MTGPPNGGPYSRYEGPRRSTVHRRFANACVGRASLSRPIRAGLKQHNRMEDGVGLYGDGQIGKKAWSAWIRQVPFRDPVRHRTDFSSRLLASLHRHHRALWISVLDTRLRRKS